MEKILTRINRISAYILLVLVLLILITGYRQVGYFTFFTRGLANSLHQIYLNIAGLVVGSVHILISIRKALVRNKIKGIWVAQRRHRDFTTYLSFVSRTYHKSAIEQKPSRTAGYF